MAEVIGGGWVYRSGISFGNSPIQITANRVVRVLLHPRVDDTSVVIRERFRALEDWGAKRLFRERKRARGDGGQALRHFNRAIEQHARRAFLVDQPQSFRFVDLNGATGEDQIA